MDKIIIINLKLILFIITIIFELKLNQVKSDHDYERLLDDLFTNYDTVVRPVSDSSDHLKLYLGIKLSQIADIDERNQIMTTNVWVRHEWYDYKLKWNPDKYGNITKIKIPTNKIWLADIVLADGDYQITTQTKATILYDGKIIWEPPMIYKSYCAIDIEYYPFDIQDCYMKFGTWTFDGNLIDLEHVKRNESIPAQNILASNNGVSTKLYTVELGIDMSDYYESVEWDILSIPAQKNIKYYDCCMEPYYDIYFNITIRRKTLFYTVNLIIPCVNISFLSVLVFYLPSSSGEKITLGIYVLVALLVFYLLLIELIPPTSLVIPLLGKYLLFTLILVNLSILLTIFILNLHHRNPNTHKMPLWMKKLFLIYLPKLLVIQRPDTFDDIDYKYFNFMMNNNTSRKKKYSWSVSIDKLSKAVSKLVDQDKSSLNDDQVEIRERSEMNTNMNMNMNMNIKNKFEKKLMKKYPSSIRNALNGLNYLHDRMNKDNQERKEIDDWKYAAMVIDRLLLWIFSFVFFIGTFGILLKAPSIYDTRMPITKKL